MLYLGTLKIEIEDVTWLVSIELLYNEVWAEHFLTKVLYQQTAHSSKTFSSAQVCDLTLQI